MLLQEEASIYIWHQRWGQLDDVLDRNGCSVSVPGRWILLESGHVEAQIFHLLLGQGSQREKRKPHDVPKHTCLVSLKRFTKFTII